MSIQLAQLNPLASKPVIGESLNYLSSGFMEWSQPQALDVRDIWAAYQRRSLTDQEMLLALSKRVEDLNAATVARKSTLVVTTMLDQCKCLTTLDTADAIDAFLSWADYHAITVIDRDD
ncbi:MAG: hypothetical protein H7228_01775 [Polaromonas sp.]|nr:hypothetical protein [Polaromonas sp.]